MDSSQNQDLSHGKNANKEQQLNVKGLKVSKEGQMPIHKDGPNVQSNNSTIHVKSNNDANSGNSSTMDYNPEND